MATASKEITLQDKSVELSNPGALVGFAAELKKFIVQENLFTTIANKKYVEVQGWQFCMLATGVVPIVVETVDLSKDDEIKYKAVVELRRMSDDKVMGSGVAICSNKESKKKSFDDYAVLSMAQTRAIGKAGRNLYGWLMKMAGYEATPAEEMGAVGDTGDGGALPVEVIEKLKKATNNQELSEVLGGLDPEQKKEAAKIIAERLKELKTTKEEA